VLLAWPTETGPFSHCYPEIERAYVAIATAISLRETVLIAAPETLFATIRQRLSASGADAARIRVLGADYDDNWVRDTAPLTVETLDGATLIDFRFNGWGGKYPCTQDAAFARALVNTGIFMDARMEASEFVLEGGSIESDGCGTLLTSRYCLLNPNRNPGMTQADIEATLRDRLGASRVLWLSHGHVAGDDTDAHVDTLARFCDDMTIAYTACDDRQDEHFASLGGMENELRLFRTAAGAPYRLVPLPIPKAILDEDGTRLPATYANFLIINGAVLMPIYGDANDAVARERLSSCFPKREIVPIDCTALIRQYGSLHCMTMQFPKSITVLPR
jgi:agmatine/peptidylarginine deiminase